MLSLNHYFFIEQSVIATPEYNESSDIVGESTTSFHIDLNEELKIIHIMCTVTTDNPEYAPYDISMQAIAIFSYTDEDDPHSEVFDQRVKEMGSNVLLGAIRDRVHFMTATGPYPMVILE